jgi:hypothetical protein
MSVYAKYRIDVTIHLMCALTIRNVEISCHIYTVNITDIMYCNTDSKTKRISIYTIIERPQLMCDYPLNLSILIRGGKETKWDSPSSGERKGNSSARRVVGFNAY